MNKFYQLHNKSLQKHKAENIKELWTKLKAKGYKGLSVQMATKFTKAEGADNKYHAVFSTASVDRHGDIVEQNWLLKHYKNNPVYLDSHDYSSIEKIIGRVEGLKGNGLLEGDIIFATQNPLGQLAKDLTDGGFLNTSSVGFIPKKFDDKFEKILESELLEISAVSVPANPEALYGKSINKEVKGNNEDTDKGLGDNEVKGTELIGTKSEDNSETERKASEEKEVIADEVINVKSTKTSDQILYELVKSEVDIKKQALDRILNATKQILAEIKVATGKTVDRKDEKSIVNKAISELLKLKKEI